MELNVKTYRPGFPVIDVHAHAAKNPASYRQIAKRYPEIKLAGDASIEQAAESMAENGIIKRVIKNLAVLPERVIAFNDWAIEVARRYPGQLFPTGTIHPDFPGNEQEVERLAEAGIRGIAFDSCWQGFMIDDPRLRTAYQIISRRKMFVLTHTGIDPQAPHREIETWAPQVLAVQALAPDSKIIAAHLGANFHFERVVEYPRNSGLMFDLAWVAEMVELGLINEADILRFIDHLGDNNIVYGSDYPWADPASQLAFWEKLFVDMPDTWARIGHLNAERELLLDGPA